MGVIVFVISITIVNCSLDPVRIEEEEEDNDPIADIASPDDDDSFLRELEVAFRGSGTDLEDGPLPENSLVWTSDKDSVIGTGSAFSRFDLSVNLHVITLTVTDSDGRTDADWIAIHIIPDTSRAGFPTAEITEPVGQSSYILGEAITFRGTATDPEDGGVWVQEGPHLMLLMPKSALAGISRDPFSGGPYVMWEGTSMIHLMVPVTVAK